MEVLIHTFIQTKATWGKRTCPRFETASVGLNPGPLDLETCALPTRLPRPRSISSSFLVYRRRVLSSCCSLVWDDCLRRRCSHRPSWSIFGQLCRKWAYLPHPKHRGSLCADQSSRWSLKSPEAPGGRRSFVLAMVPCVVRGEAVHFHFINNTFICIE